MTALSAAARRAAGRLLVGAGLALAVLVAVVYAVGFDQGLLLTPVLGQVAAAENHLHEFFHDARHLLGFPCH